MLTTALFVAVELAALVWGGMALRAFVIVSLGMFAVGCVAFLWAFVLAVARSRWEPIAVSTIYGLAGTTAKGVRVRLFGSIAVVVVAAIVGAALRPFTPMAFGVLAPMFAVGMTGLWGARYGGDSAPPSARRADLALAPTNGTRQESQS